MCYSRARKAMDFVEDAANCILKGEYTEAENLLTATKELMNREKISHIKLDGGTRVIDSYMRVQSELVAATKT